MQNTKYKAIKLFLLGDKKITTLILFFFLSISVLGQINFKSVILNIPNYSNIQLKSAKIGDVTNDGLNDLVVGSTMKSDGSAASNIYLFVQKKDGLLSEPIEINYSKSNIQLYDIEVADMNNDKLNDIVITFGYTIGIFYQLPTGGFSPLKIITNDITGWYGIKTGDLNNDGLNDVLAFQNGSFKIFYQTQSGDFTLTTFPAETDYCTQLQIGDLNNDGLIDIVKISGSQIEIHYQKRGSGISTDSSFIIDANKSVFYFEGIAIDDINNDGRNDVVVNYGGSMGAFKIYYQNATGGIDTTNVKTVKTYDNPFPVSIADLNCDGDKEIIFGHNGWNNVSVFDKHGIQDYNGYKLFHSLENYNDFNMAVGDLNNDGRKDIVVVDLYAKVNVLYNISKPLTFDSYETKIANMQIKRDTTDSLVNSYYTTIINTESPFENVNYYKNDIVKLYSNEHYTGDSLLIRHGMLCSAYTDTIVTPFSYSKSFSLKLDTIKSIVNSYSPSENVGNYNVKIYPNPIKDNLIIESSQLLLIKQIQIYGLNGLILPIKNPSYYTAEIDARQLPKGIYIMKIITESDIIIRKIIKE